MVFRRHRAVIFVHGCFWHGHDCKLFVIPKTRQTFWLAKIRSNQIRDRKSHTALRALGWRVLTVWECAFRGASSKIVQTAHDAADFITSAQCAEEYIRETGRHRGSGYEFPLVPERAAAQPMD
jgi:DNA mismatch endonuclease (patch repair protein)